MQSKIARRVSCVTLLSLRDELFLKRLEDELILKRLNYSSTSSQLLVISVLQGLEDNHLECKTLDVPPNQEFDN